ncbi:class I SAM-dependent methyltransferase [Alkalihalobacillus sp. MEB130]|uniref:class I SAM-dependent methyltransferase n=1 Tax=Alkalihalobacillus sp. MEB130 TaxID=2976704 RepID=UPI0028DD46F3|nr:class I SAM-dependent methyltransferase [Alkalihalobacillus sp. MEB130]MDT8862300.1 class I SAM-dependent methyltransferase [Alkalihalobacillus sp. MEB130]
MSDHYYSEKPTVDSEERDFAFTLRGKSFRFFSDRGVFSKSEIDYGSQLLIDSFVFPTIEGDFLDVGCGYGPIGLSLASVEKDRVVHMVDINERALNLSSKNADRNSINNVKIYKSDRLVNVEKNDFAAIITNPPIRAGKQIVHSIFEQSFEHLKEQGELWIVIQKKQGAPSAIEKLESLFNEVDIVLKKKGYYIIVAKKV